MDYGSLRILRFSATLQLIRGYAHTLRRTHGCLPDLCLLVRAVYGCHITHRLRYAHRRAAPLPCRLLRHTLYVYRLPVALPHPYTPFVALLRYRHPWLYGWCSSLTCPHAHLRTGLRLRYGTRAPFALRSRLPRLR